MVKWTVEQMAVLMKQPSRIRNMSVIAHVDHGKSTLTDALLAKAGLMASSQSGAKRMMDDRDDEQKRGITIKSASASLVVRRVEADPETSLLINVIDSPGHVDFSSEVSAALRVSDGALVVVDCVEGVCVQTETVLRQALGERIKPALFVNKVDRLLVETKPSLEDCYRKLSHAIESVDAVCQTYRDEALAHVRLAAEKGNVGFGSGLHAWGFSLADWAAIYAGRFSLSRAKMMIKLWGGNYWDADKRKWVGEATHDGSTVPLQRGFCQFVLWPLRVLTDAILAEDAATWQPIVQALGLKLDKKDVEASTAKELLKLVMRTWLPAGDCLVRLVDEHLPSPDQAQAYRVDKLYSGALDSAEAQAIAKCDATAELAMYVSKMVPAGGKGQFVAFGRIFSGTIRANQQVRILGPQFTVGGKHDLALRKVSKVLVMMGSKGVAVDQACAGNLCALVGVDDAMDKTGTITTSESLEPFRTMVMSVAAVVQVAVEPKRAGDLPKLVQGLKKLSKADSLVKTSVSPTGQHIVAGAGELHLEICLKDLRELFMRDAELIVSKPIVSYCEGVTARSTDTVTSKSPNKLNRLWASASPLDSAVVSALDGGHLRMGSDAKLFGQRMRDEFGWEASEARRIWAFGVAPDAACNCLVDQTKGASLLSEIKDNVVAGFLQGTLAGALCEEAVRGLRINLADAKVHCDPAHRGASQIVPCAKRVVWGCMMASAPCLLEPLYQVEVTAPHTALSGVFSTLSARRGEVTCVSEQAGTPLSQVRGLLPVAESFGFTEALRKNTGGQAFPQMQFAEWRAMPGDVLDPASAANAVVRAVRLRKGLKEEVPRFTDFHDRL